MKKVIKTEVRINLNQMEKRLLNRFEIKNLTAGNLDAKFTNFLKKAEKCEGKNRYAQMTFDLMQNIEDVVQEHGTKIDLQLV
jgi:hypothetical protein